MKTLIEFDEKDIAQALYNYAKKKHPHLGIADVYIKHNSTTNVFTAYAEGETK